MARISWRGDLRTLRMRIENLPQEKLDQAEKIMEDVTKEGADLMRQYIETRGTPKSGKAGRIESAEMLNAVQSAVHRNPKSVRGEFGWGVSGGPHEKYFDYQENGFRHWRSGENVPPMHAQLDAFMKMRIKFFSRLRSEMGAGSR
jgi:hypothetical protein